MKDPKKKITKLLSECEDKFREIQFEVDQALYNLEHAQEQLKADLKEGFYFDGKNTWELIKTPKNKMKRRKINEIH